MRTLALVLSATTLTWAGGAALPQDRPRDEWTAFSGTWSAVGRRQTLRTETARAAAIVQLSGTLALSNAASSGLPVAFRAEAIGFDDGDRVGVGRAVWTDARGDVVFSVLNGERLETGRRVSGTITGGTGRYTGLTGEWALTWQFVVETDEGEVQGRAADVKGRFRRAATRP
jgi:hypothetical protein